MGFPESWLMPRVASGATQDALSRGSQCAKFWIRQAGWFRMSAVGIWQVMVARVSFASLSGGNQVDGLPPSPSLCFLVCMYGNVHTCIFGLVSMSMCFYFAYIGMHTRVCPLIYRHVHVCACSCTLRSSYVFCVHTCIRRQTVNQVTAGETRRAFTTQELCE